MQALVRSNQTCCIVAPGARATAGNGTLTWPDISMGSYCGDAVNESRWDTPGPVQATYVQGQAVDLDVVVAVNHLVGLESIGVEGVAADLWL